MNLLILGGSAAERARVALRFHRESPLRSGPMLTLDCSREESRLRASLQFWLTRSSRDHEENPLWAAARGTLFLDAIECLTPATQRLLLLFADGCADANEEPNATDWAGRLTAGSDEDLAPAVSAGRFLAPLYDHLDKIRLELGPRVHQGAA